MWGSRPIGTDLNPFRPLPGAATAPSGFSRANAARAGGPTGAVLSIPGMGTGRRGAESAHSTQRPRQPRGARLGRAGPVPLGVVGRVPRCLFQQCHVAQHAGEDEEHAQGVGPPATQTACVGARKARVGPRRHGPPEGRARPSTSSSKSPERQLRLRDSQTVLCWRGGPFGRGEWTARWLEASRAGGSASEGPGGRLSGLRAPSKIAPRPTS